MSRALFLAFEYLEGSLLHEPKPLAPPFGQTHDRILADSRTLMAEAVPVDCRLSSRQNINPASLDGESPETQTRELANKQLWDLIGKVDEWREEFRQAIALATDSFETPQKFHTEETGDLLEENVARLYEILSRFGDLRIAILNMLSKYPKIDPEIFHNTWAIQMKDLRGMADATLHWSNIDYWPKSKRELLDIMKDLETLEQ
ncbi:hypothetical protein HDK77DRAFT_482542 [Phyllosticta capitalensis]|uniref:uncharacterized protein n=1 Tax=Phyllosticta capitalensis TaxID=121624 RepID=UPI0031320BFA